MTFYQRFLELRHVFDFFERRRDTSDLCFAMQDEIFALEFRIFFEDTSRKLISSNYCRVSIFQQGKCCVWATLRHRVCFGVYKSAVSKNASGRTLNWLFCFFIKIDFSGKLL